MTVVLTSSIREPLIQAKADLRDYGIIGYVNGRDGAYTLLVANGRADEAQTFLNARIAK